MLPDPTISIAGQAVTVFQLFTAGALLLCSAALLLAYRREWKLTLRRSPTTEELFDQLLRIANSLERIADQASASAIAEAPRRTEPGHLHLPPAEPAREEHHVAYSMFGR
jgi:hypothetical protein